MADKTRAELLRERLAELLVDQNELLLLVVTKDGDKIHAATQTFDYPLADLRLAVEHLKTNAKRMVQAKIRSGEVGEGLGRDLLRAIELGDGKLGGKEECHVAHVGDERDSLSEPDGGVREGESDQPRGGVEPALPSGAR